MENKLIEALTFHVNKKNIQQVHFLMYRVVMYNITLPNYIHREINNLIDKLDNEEGSISSCSDNDSGIDC